MSIFEITLTGAIVLLCISMILTLVRFFIGPSLADRITALDLISANLIAIIIIYSMISKNLIFMDAALILSLIAFLGTMSFAYYLIQHRK